MPHIMWHNVRMATKMTAPTARELDQYFDDWLGAQAGSERNLIHLIESGLPLKVIPRLIQRGLSKDEVFSIIVNPRTLKHRRSKSQPLSKEESERAIRAVRILARAQAVFGDEASALRWLRSPKKRFDGRSPMQMLPTEPGGRLVEEMLIQIDEGMFA
jgi:putative toxin-antitoxin system antitoxin component (TIGR02293 family)